MKTDGPERLNIEARRSFFFVGAPEDDRDVYLNMAVAALREGFAMSDGRSVAAQAATGGSC